MGCHTEGTLWCLTCSTTWWPAPVRFDCPFCGKGSMSFVCDKCRDESFLDGLSVFAHYGNPVVREAIHQWKYIGDKTAQDILFRWLVRGAPALQPPFSNFVFAPIPLHIFKRRERGFDQAGILADWCGQIFNRPVFDLLIRTRQTKSQAQKSHEVRKLGELDGLFSINSQLAEFPDEVVLCDDVFTSGATMDSAARCLKEHGVKRVWGIVIAKGNM
ncbi:ComF family protein [Candidatus Uhrbacteria bacterium]|nr:ComF family protein [Candidatus Uhrbacteria bacterium]